MITDPIADFLTQIRNAVQIGKPMIETKASYVKRCITQILYEQGVH